MTGARRAAWPGEAAHLLARARGAGESGRALHSMVQEDSRAVVDDARAIGQKGAHRGAIVKREGCTLFSGAAAGAEAEFGAASERYGIEEVNYTFEGHNDARRRGIRVLTNAELRRGDVSLAYVGKLMHRRYHDTPLFKKVLQSIWHQVNSGQEIYVVGKILDDNTVKGGTGWGAEFAKLCDKPLFVWDQERNAWFRWAGDRWEPLRDPVIGHPHFTGTGTRFLNDGGRAAIEGLFARSFPTG
jgi:hypothetical protein